MNGALDPEHPGYSHIQETAHGCTRIVNSFWCYHSSQNGHTNLDSSALASYIIVYICHSVN